VFRIPSVVIVDLQFGDSGKGKIVDYLGDHADVVVRFQGGHNAGHTVVADGKTFKLHLLPSGVVRGKRVLIGNGVVVEPKHLLKEIAELRAQGLNVDVGVSERAHVILEKHVAADDPHGKIGTTRRGIGPAYSDKHSRHGLRIIDLLDEGALREKVGNGWESYLEAGHALSPFFADVSAELNDALDAGKVVLLEGAQGTLLDIDHGTYPFVTSSNCTAGAACTGTGISPKRVDRIIGVAKAYTTRVGSGPFPTELSDGIGEKIRERGHEFGTTTGRPRRCGWFDAVQVNYSRRVNGIDELAITKLDILDGIDPLRVCVAYDWHGKRLAAFPSSVKVLEDCKPVFEDFAGWPETDWSRVKTWESMPQQARHYVEELSRLCHVPITMVGIGPSREQTISVPQAAMLRAR
jgi:adenylosuccinate synthase